MKGFTLVELLVVIVIFSITIGSITGIFISGLSSQRRILAEQEILNQISYAIEYMGKAIRMAKKDDIKIGDAEKHCLSGEKVNYEVSLDKTKITFRNYQNQCQSFYLNLNSNQIFEDKEGTVLALTSPKIKVNSLKFMVSGESQNDTLQPRVTIFMEVESSGKKLQFQTTISQRDIDVQY
jgi:prepilin-type N-terminal cleavage/methylation domain-containing protein